MGTQFKENQIVNLKRQLRKASIAEGWLGFLCFLTPIGSSIAFWPILWLISAIQGPVVANPVPIWLHLHWFGFLCSFVVGIVIWLISLLPFYLFEVRRTRCPKCHRPFAGVKGKQTTSVAGRSTTVIPTQRAVRKTPFGEPIGYVDDLMEVPVTSYLSSTAMRCKYCSHTWTLTENSERLG